MNEEAKQIDGHMIKTAIAVAVSRFFMGIPFMSSRLFEKRAKMAERLDL